MFYFSQKIIVILSLVDLTVTVQTDFVDLLVIENCAISKFRIPEITQKGLKLALTLLVFLISFLICLPQKFHIVFSRMISLCTMTVK